MQLVTTGNTLVYEAYLSKGYSGAHVHNTVIVLFSYMYIVYNSFYSYFESAFNFILSAFIFIYLLLMFFFVILCDLLFFSLILPFWFDLFLLEIYFYFRVSNFSAYV